MNQQPKTSSQGQWVRLHLEKQSETSTMPESITGYMYGETAVNYALSKVIEYQEDEETYEILPVPVDKVMMINRTYVLGIEILGEQPPTTPFNGEGGLG